jgi:hypothetical protein
MIAVSWALTPTLCDSRGYIMAPTTDAPDRNVARQIGVRQEESFFIGCDGKNSDSVKSRSFEHGTTRRKADVSGGDVSPSYRITGIVFTKCTRRNDYKEDWPREFHDTEAGINEGTACCFALPSCAAKSRRTEPIFANRKESLIQSVDHRRPGTESIGDVELYTWGNAPTSTGVALSYCWV